MDRIQQIQKSTEAIRPSRRTFLKGLVAAGAALTVPSFREDGNQGEDNGGSSGSNEIQEVVIDYSLVSKARNFINNALRGNTRIARAESLTAGTEKTNALSVVAKTEQVMGSCAPLSDIEIAEIHQCVGPNRAGFYLTSELYENKNGKPKYQADGDVIKGKYDAEFLITNTANPNESFDARVNEFGELYYEVKDKDGKIRQVRVFVFSGTPNATTPDGRPAIKAEVREKNAYDKTLKKVVELGDAMYYESAVNCTPLPVYLRKDESYLTPPAEVPVKEQVIPAAPVIKPSAPVQLPPIQGPSKMPDTGDGSLYEGG